MTNSLPVRDVIAFEENYVHASTEDRGEYSVLTVDSALRNRDTASWNQPWQAVLSKHCHAWVSAHVARDDLMMGGRATVWEWHYFTECPGSAVRHDCRA